MGRLTELPASPARTMQRGRKSRAGVGVRGCCDVSLECLSPRTVIYSIALSSTVAVHEISAGVDCVYLRIRLSGGPVGISRGRNKLKRGGVSTFGNFSVGCLWVSALWPLHLRRVRASQNNARLRNKEEAVRKGRRVFIHIRCNP